MVMSDESLGAPMLGIEMRCLTNSTEILVSRGDVYRILSEGFWMVSREATRMKGIVLRPPNLSEAQMVRNQAPNPQGVHGLICVIYARKDMSQERAAGARKARSQGVPGRPGTDFYNPPPFEQGYVPPPPRSQ